MSRHRASVRFFATFVALFAVAPLHAADDPLDAFPAETGVVLRLASPAELSGKIKAFLGNAAPQFAPIADQLGPGLGSLIGNPTLAGVDAGRPWYVAVLPRSAAAPAVVFAVPAADASALKKAVGQGYTFADFENWAVYSLDGDAMKAVQARVGGDGTSVREAIAGTAGDVFNAGEIAAFLNVPVLRVAYKAQIEKAKEELAKSAQVPADAPPAAKAAMEYNVKTLETLLGVIDDLVAVSTRITIGEAALTDESVLVVAPGTPSAEFFAKQTTSDFPLLAKLPSGRPVYYGLAGDLGELIAASTQMTSGLSPENEALKARLERLTTFEFQEIVGTFELGNLEDGIYRGVSLAKVDAVEKYRDLARELLTTMGEIETPGVRQSVTLQPEAETIEGVKVDVVKITMTPEPESDPTGTAQKFLDILFGKEGLTQRMTVADGLFVQSAGSAEVMEAALKAIQGAGDVDEAAAKATAAMREQLDEKANVYAAFDLPRLFRDGLQLAVDSNQVPLPLDPQAIRGLELSPSYTGATVSAGPNEVRIRGVMPAEQVRGIVDLFRLLQQAAPGRNRAE